MTESLEQPGRKDPVVRTRTPRLPPLERSRVALALTAAAALGRFELQVCRDCGTVQYPPPRGLHRCLSAKVDWKLQSGSGELISATTLYHKSQRVLSGAAAVAAGHDPARFRPRGNRSPARRRALRSDACAGWRAPRSGGPRCSHCISSRIDPGNPSMTMPLTADDKLLREMTSDPKLRKVLITDGRLRSVLRSPAPASRREPLSSG